MKVITVTREYGSGGREVARLLAARLGWELLDHALLHQAAELEHLPDSELEQMDEKAVSMAAFHVRLVASPSVRLRRVMEYHWLAEAPARKLIAESDAHRHRFYADYFEADWSDPLEYDATVNSGRLGSTAVELVAFAAERSWKRTGEGKSGPG